MQTPKKSTNINSVSMTTMMAGNIVIIREVCAHTNGDRLFTGIQVYETGQFPRSELLAGAFLKLANRLHLLVQVKQLGFIQRLCAHASALLSCHSCKPPDY